jgi:hypothetical protein
MVLLRSYNLLLHSDYKSVEYLQGQRQKNKYFQKATIMDVGKYLVS